MARRGRGRLLKTTRALRAKANDNVEKKRPSWEMVIERKAVANDWIISKKRKATLISEMYRTIENGDAARDQIAAARVVVAADSINVARERQRIPEEHIHTHTGQVDIRAAVVEMQQEPEYVDWLNQRALEVDGFPVTDGEEPE